MSPTATHRWSRAGSNGARRRRAARRIDATRRRLQQRSSARGALMLPFAVGRDARTVGNSDSRRAARSLPNGAERAFRPALAALCTCEPHDVTDIHLDVSFRHLSRAHDMCDRCHHSWNDAVHDLEALCPTRIARFAILLSSRRLARWKKVVLTGMQRPPASLF